MSHHIFICADQTNPKCCSKEKGLEVYDYLKKRLAELGLNKENKIRRSKANCLQVCKNGPVMVIYPEGKWYENVDKDKIDEVLQSLN